MRVCARARVWARVVRGTGEGSTELRRGLPGRGEQGQGGEASVLGVGCRGLGSALRGPAAPPTTATWAPRGQAFQFQTQDSKILM